MALVQITKYPHTEPLSLSSSWLPAPPTLRWSPWCLRRPHCKFSSAVLGVSQLPPLSHSLSPQETRRREHWRWVLATRHNFFFLFLHTPWHLLEVCVFPCFWIRSPQSLVEAHVVHVHGLSDDPGNDKNHCVWFCFEKAQREEGKRVWEWEDGTKIIRWFYRVLFSWKTSKFMWEQANLNILTCQSQPVCWPKMGR